MASKQVMTFLKNLGNESVPVDVRVQQLTDVLVGYKNKKEDGDLPEDYQACVAEVFNRLANATADENAKERARQLEGILKMLESAPLKPATFIEVARMEGSRLPHAMVALDNGDFGYVVIHDHAMVKKLKLGDRVVIDSKGILLMLIAANELKYGEEVRYERIIDDRHIEVIDGQDQRSVVLANHKLMAQIESGEVVPNTAIILCTGGQVGLCALPKAEEEFSHFRFLDRGGIPNVIADRDIGSPSRLIGRVERHIKEEMLRPELRRRFKLRPCISSLLEGVSGTGKTLTVQAIHRRMYEIMAEVTGTAMENLPPRVFRFKPSKALSMWLGESDKNCDRFFDEVEQLAGKKFKNAEGKEFSLPVLVVMEEADGMGRARGEEAIYDRIMTTILQRLDPNREGLGDKLVIFLSTTNEPHIIDPAFLRRIGGTVETFGRLDQKGFVDVLKKHVKGLPIDKDVVGDINHALFDEGVDAGVVELAVGGKTVVRHRRDFVTGALIDRAVQDAATNAWEMAVGGDKDATVTSEHLLSALDRQVLSVVNQLTPNNVGHYLDIPEGVRVTEVRKLASKV